MKEVKTWKSTSGYSCQFCAPVFDTTDGIKVCSSENNGMFCSREEGHEGDHVACRILQHNHIIGSWPQEKSK